MTSGRNGRDESSTASGAVDFDEVIHRFTKGWLDGPTYNEPIEDEAGLLLLQSHAHGEENQTLPALRGRERRVVLVGDDEHPATRLRIIGNVESR